MVNWTGVARKAASAGGKGGGSTFPKGAGMAVVCGLATVIALPAIGYSYGESAATARVEAAHPTHDLLWSNEPSIPSTAHLDVPDPLSAARSAAADQRAQAAYWKSQTVTVPRSTTVNSSGGSVVSSVGQSSTKAQAQPKQAKATTAPKQSSAPKAPKQSTGAKAASQPQPSTTVTVTQTQSTSTTAKGTTTTKNSTSTKTTTKG